MLRIATWNLDESSTTNNKRAAHQLGKIRSINADIWVLTETKSSINLSSLNYYNVASKTNEYGKNYVSIWSKFPIEKTIKTYDQELTSCCKINITKKKSIIIYGAIITYLADKGILGKSEFAEEHYKAIINQSKDWGKIQKEESCEVICIAGDFNQPRDGSDWYFAHGANKKGVEELTNQLELNNLECLTSENFYSTKRLKDRHNVDHICLTKNQVQVKKVEVWQGTYGNGIKLSDHNGVYTDIIFSK